MMHDPIEHTEHRRPAEERDRTVAWSGPVPDRDEADQAEGARP